MIWFSHEYLVIIGRYLGNGGKPHFVYLSDLAPILAPCRVHREWKYETLDGESKHLQRWINHSTSLWSIKRQRQAHRVEFFLFHYCWHDFNSLQLQKETPYRQTIQCYKICHVSHKHLTDFSGGYTRKIAFQDDNLRIKIILLLYHFKAVYGTTKRHGGEWNEIQTEIGKKAIWENCILASQVCRFRFLSCRAKNKH